MTNSEMFELQMIYGCLDVEMETTGSRIAELKRELIEVSQRRKKILDDGDAICDGLKAAMPTMTPWQVRQMVKFFAKITKQAA